MIIPYFDKKVNKKALKIGKFAEMKWVEPPRWFLKRFSRALVLIEK